MATKFHIDRRSHIMENFKFANSPLKGYKSEMDNIETRIPLI